MRLLDDKLAEAFLNEPTREGECIICDLDEVQRWWIGLRLLSELSLKPACVGS